MKKLIASLIFLILLYPVFSQQSSVKGIVTDTATRHNLQRAVICLLNNKDSVLYKFTRTNNTGNFELKNLIAGKYIVMASYPSYADFKDTVTVSEGTPLDLGKIILTTKAHLLEEVIVKQRVAAIKLKGDTIEYKADSFKVPAGAVVEDMLRRLPGVQVDRSGKITAQGQEVQKILVDGEEFFGDDPTIATRNLEATAIDKVQIYDKKSDQAVLTGIDDGQRTKTINLTLKEDRKKGYFGKIDAGAGPDDKWNVAGMANRFTSKNKFSIYGNMSSIGGSGVSDAPTASSNKNGQSSYSGSGTNGLPKTWNAAANYNDKYNNGKENLNSSYRYGKTVTETAGNTRTQSILPDTLFYNNSSYTGKSLNESNNLNGRFDWKIDSTINATITGAGTFGNSSNYSANMSEALNADHMVVNTSNQINNTTGHNNTFNGNAVIIKKFKNPRRSISLNINDVYGESKSENYMNSLTQFFDKSSNMTMSDTINQKKLSTNTRNNLVNNFAYSDALSTRLSIQVSYNLGINTSTSQLLSYDRDSSGKYSVLNKLYSNSFNYNIISNAGGLTLSYNSKKFNMNISGNISNSDYYQKDLIKDSSFRYSYINFSPSSFIFINVKNAMIFFNYSGNTTQPSIQQIQPVANNSNPLYITIGNPNLQQSFSHNFSFNYNRMKMMSPMTLFAFGSFGTTANAIENSTYTDSLGRTVSQFINTNGNYSYSGSLSWGYNFKKISSNLKLTYALTGSHSVNYVNFLKNTTVSNYQSVTFNFTTSKEKYYVMTTAQFGYNHSVSSIRPDVKNDFLNMTYGVNGVVQLPFHFETSTDLNFYLRQKTPTFPTNNNVVLWNAYIAKKFLKNDKAQIRFTVNDILAQNRGFNRNTNGASVTESSYETIGRYCLLSFLWNFTKTTSQNTNQNQPTATPLK
ncbi:outer membrane beta-barrel protein [Chitinophagaceae bacterium LWZ2-11]